MDTAAQNISVEDLDQLNSDKILDQHKNIEETFIGTEKESDFKRIIDALSENYKEVLMLRLEGLKHKEIATVLNISEEAVRSRMRRAIVKLKKPFEKFYDNYYKK